MSGRECAGRAGRWLDAVAALPQWMRLAWWGLVEPRLPGRPPLVVHQAVVIGPEGVLLALREELRGWELPGGAALPGESGEQALRREVLEETGVEVGEVHCVAVYERSGFRPHVARIYRCDYRSGLPAPSVEMPAVAWFTPDEVPDSLFPWFRGPLADGLAAHPQPVTRRESQGLRAIAAGMRIDLATRVKPRAS
ncbi:MAG: NUDIX domain-containing protein [Myxococcota bacterium]